MEICDELSERSCLGSSRSCCKNRPAKTRNFFSKVLNSISRLKCS